METRNKPTQVLVDVMGNQQYNQRPIQDQQDLVALAELDIINAYKSLTSDPFLADLIQARIMDYGDHVNSPTDLSMKVRRDEWLILLANKLAGRVNNGR